ncbi:MAG: response regulator [Elusimicrobiota bacterium]
MQAKDCRILVVDPSQNALSALRKVLSSAGFGVDTAQNTVDALSLMLEGGHSLALLDAALHDRPVSETIAQFKHLRPELRILLMAGSPEKAVPAEGVEGVLKKPFSNEELLSAIRRSLKG